MTIRDILIQESINDKNLFKAVFMAGGPGSGKSFVAKHMFGIKSGEVFSNMGIKVVNSDDLFERGLKKNNLPLKIASSESNKELHDKQMEVRDHYKVQTDKRMTSYTNSMLPIIIDGTGKDFNKIVKQADWLKSLGYDVSMVLISTPLEIALERNAKRERSVSPELLKSCWSQVRNNTEKFQEYFGLNNFAEIKLDKTYDSNTEEGRKFLNRLYIIGKRFLESPLRNPIGRKKIQDLRSSGKKYPSELS